MSYVWIVKWSFGWLSSLDSSTPPPHRNATHIFWWFFFLSLELILDGWNSCRSRTKRSCMRFTPHRLMAAPYITAEQWAQGMNVGRRLQIKSHYSHLNNHPENVLVLFQDPPLRFVVGHSLLRCVMVLQPFLGFPDLPTLECSVHLCCKAPPAARGPAVPPAQVGGLYYEKHVLPRCSLDGGGMTSVCVTNDVILTIWSRWGPPSLILVKSLFSPCNEDIFEGR